MGNCANCNKFVFSFTYVNRDNPSKSWCETCYRQSPLPNPYLGVQSDGTRLIVVKPKRINAPLDPDARDALFRTWGQGRIVRYHTSAQHIYEHITGATAISDGLDQARRLSLSAESRENGKITSAGLAKDYVLGLLADEIAPLRDEVWSVVLQLAPKLVSDFVKSAAPILGTAMQGAELVSKIREWHEASSMNTVTAQVAFSLPNNQNVQLFSASLSQLCEAMRSKAQIDTGTAAVKLVIKVVSDVLAPSGAAAAIGVTVSVVEAIAGFSVLVYNIANDLKTMKKLNGLLANCSVKSFEECPWLAVFALTDLGNGLDTSTMLGIDITKMRSLNKDDEQQIFAEMAVIERLIDVAKGVADSTRLRLVGAGSAKLGFAMLDDKVMVLGASCALSSVQDAMGEL